MSGEQQHLATTPNDALATAIRRCPVPKTAAKIIDELKTLGWVLVPRVPTARMISEGESAASIGIGKPTDEHAIPRVYAAMMEAA